MSLSAFDEFMKFLDETVQNQTCAGLKIYDKRRRDDDIKMILVKPVKIKQGYSLSFVFRHPTKDVTKNYPIIDGLDNVVYALENDFYQAELKTSDGDMHLITDAKGKTKLKRSGASSDEPVKLSHDKEKKRLIVAENNIYLEALGITNEDGIVRKDMQDKYRQINKYIEIMDGILKDLPRGETLTVADMGAGKGYLTFALYDYLVNVLKQKSEVIGVELRGELVQSCNRLASKAKFDGLKFVEGRIEDIKLPKLDVLIALHACNTATDDAIYRGIKAEAGAIICAPCCHKQIRAELNPGNEMTAIVKHGILKERQAELLTDGLRALYLEACGYKTRVFEFISTEHTPKNVLIVGIKSPQKKTPDAAVMDEIEAIKKMFGIKTHYLETLLGELK